jgi:TolB-like protein/DNA-binding winged helix-turn-helix (wHTH) protein/Flp pilus assembly protein TadD
MPVTAEHRHGYRFGVFVLDLDRRALLREDREVPLRPKSFDVLHLLVERAGVLVSKDDLLERIWPDTVVSDDSLSQCLFEIRRALADRERTIVRTVPRRGVIFELPVSPLEGESDSVDRAGTARRSTRALQLSGGTLLAMVALALGWLLLFGKPDGASNPEAVSKPAAPPPPDRSIAVLAFDDLSPEGDYGWFADGLSEEVLNLLAQVQELNVIARTSSFSFRGSDADISTIAERLSVTHVLEGSVRKDGEQLRITVQLVAAESDSHLWSRSYDRVLNDVFGVQSDIARAVAEALELELLDGNARPADHVPDPQAWSLYLRGRYFYDRRGPGDLARAAELYHQSVERDPQWAAPRAELAATHQVMIMAGEIDSDDGLRIQREAARRALELAPLDATVLMRAARAAGMDGDRERAWALFFQAQELEPDNPLVLGAQAWFSLVRPEFGIDATEALRLVRRFARLDPVGLTSQLNLGVALLRAGLYEEAEAQFRYVRELDPANADGPVQLLAQAQLLGGRPVEALSTAQSLPQGVERHFVEALAHFADGETRQSNQAIHALSTYENVASAVRLAEIYSYRDDSEAALSWLDAACRRLTPSTPPDHGTRLILIATHSPFLVMHTDDPGFSARLEEVRREIVAILDAGFANRQAG